MNIKTKKTVFIDDNAIMLKVIGGKLDKLSFAVDTGESAESLFELMNKNEYDILFLDDMMPIMTGTEAMQKLKNAGYSKPIVVITSNEKPEDRERYLNAGFDEYIGKTEISSGGIERVMSKFDFK